MFSSILLVVGLYWAINLRDLLASITARSATIFITLCLTLFAIYSWQTLSYSPVNNAGIFSLLSPDGERYLDEAQMFACPVCLNELKGRYIDELSQYAATPKMGLSGYLSVVTFGWTPTLFSAYALMMVGMVIAGFIKIKLIDCFNISGRAKIFLALIVVLFPVDYYFTARFLREPIANELFVIGLLLLLLYQFKGAHAERFIRTLPMVIAALIIWRTQLAAVLVISSLILLPLTFRGALILVPLAMLAVFQMIRAAPVLTLALKFNSDWAYNFFRMLIDARESLAQFDGAAFIIPLALSVLMPLNFHEKRIGDLRFKLTIILIVMPWLLAELAQIRFVYPAIIWVKAALSIVLVHQVRFRLLKKPKRQPKARSLSRPYV